MQIVTHKKDANYMLTVREMGVMAEITARVVNRQFDHTDSVKFGIRGLPKPKAIMSDEDRQRKDEENRLRSIRRARQGVRWMVQRIEADHMLTLHYRENMQDPDRLKRDWDAFRRLVQDRYPHWQYVCVNEQQQRGSLHLHVAVKGHQNVNYLRICWYKVLGCVGATGANVLGNIDVTAPRGRCRASDSHWKHDRLASYMTKYMDKAFDLAEHHSKRYWASRGSPKPTIAKYWLGSANTTDMIKAVYKIAERLGINMDEKTVFQSRDQTLLYLSSTQDHRLSLTKNGDLWVLF